MRSDSVSDHPNPPIHRLPRSKPEVPAKPSPPLSIPALILVDALTFDLRVATLALIDRMVVHCHRAGYGPIHIVSEYPLPELARATAWGIQFNVAPRPPSLNEPALVVGVGWLIHPSELKSLQDPQHALVCDSGQTVPALLIDPKSISALFLEKDVTAAIARLATQRQGIPAQELVCTVRSVQEAAIATRRLWDSLRSSSDGLVDRHFNRPVGRLLFSKPLAHTPITPNQISVASILVGLLGAYAFSLGTSHQVILGALLFQLSAIIDCVDGDIARVLYKESPLGKWLDLGGDQVVHAGVFAGIALGQWRQHDDPTLLWLGGSTLLGALLSFLVVLRGLLSPKLSRNPRLQQFVDGATSRDFSVLVLILACAGHVGWFLWASAIGSHVFWITALWLQQSTRPTSTP